MRGSNIASNRGRSASYPPSKVPAARFPAPITESVGVHMRCRRPSLHQRALKQALVEFRHHARMTTENDGSSIIGLIFLAWHIFFFLRQWRERLPAMAQTRSGLNNACSALQHGMQGTKRSGCGRDVTLMFKAKVSIRERGTDSWSAMSVSVAGWLIMPRDGSSPLIEQWQRVNSQPDL